MNFIDNTHQIYQAWPSQVISDALSAFADRMRSGATAEELTSGLLALDFLTKESELTDYQEMRYDALQYEAERRIDLMTSTSRENRSEVEKDIEKALRFLDGTVRFIKNKMDQGAAEFAARYFEQFDIRFDEDPAHE